MTLGEKIDLEKLKSKNEGIELGKSKGKRGLLTQQVCIKLHQGKTLSEIIEDLVTPEAEIKPIYDIAVKFAPDYDVDTVIAEIHKAYEK